MGTGATEMRSQWRERGGQWMAVLGLPPVGV